MGAISQAMARSAEAAGVEIETEAAAGDDEGARRAGIEILKRMPRVTASGLSHQFPFAKPEHQARIVDGLRLAGLPE